MKALPILAAALALVFSSMPSVAQRMAAQTEYTPEEYSEKGQTSGCGISFLTVWSGDGREALGVSGSVNFFIVPQHKNVMAMIKASGLLNGKQTPVSYAWLETQGYGRSKDFVKGPSEDPKVFIGVKNSDAKAVALVIDVAHSGAVFGIAMKGRPLDDVVRLPAPSQDVTQKVMTCLSNLNDLAQQQLR